MPKSLLEFAAQMELPLTPAQADRLVAYARCVWEKSRCRGRVRLYRDELGNRLAASEGNTRREFGKALQIYELGRPANRDFQRDY